MSVPVVLENFTKIEQLEKLLIKHNTKLCIVMFTASWCGPCQNIKREIYNEDKEDGLSKKYSNEATFFYIDIDKNKLLADEFSITSVPCFYFMSLKEQTIEFTCEKMNGGNKNKLIECIEASLKVF